MALGKIFENLNQGIDVVKSFEGKIFYDTTRLSRFSDHSMK
ncbi:MULTISPECIES: hypothetical protein [unclassified Bartonella]